MQTPRPSGHKDATSGDLAGSTLPYLTADIPGTGGVIRAVPEDFVVTEVPLYLPCGQGEHLYLRITKRGLSTPQLVSHLSSSLGVKARAIGVAGLKDARAVTSQLVSIQGVSPDAIARVRHEGILSVEVLGCHRNRLRTGHHRGNTFRLVVRDVKPPTGEVVPAVLAQVSRRGVPNYFGPQRQGRRGDNYRVGADLLRNRGRRAQMPKRTRMWYLNAFQAHLFNLVLARRIERIDRVLPGDWAMKHENGACFQVEDAGAEQARADRFEISPTGILFGSRAPWATGEPGEIERAAAASLQETPESLRQAATGCGFRGERRTLRVSPEDLEWSLTGDRLTLSFTLPPGSYATSLLREVMKADGIAPD